MKNVKDQIVSAITALYSNTTDSYPTDWATMPAIQITEEQNKVHEVGDKENKSYIRYRIDVWNDRSTSSIAMAIDNAIGITGLGLYRSDCKDAPDPSGRKHKEMRYEGIIDADNDFVEWQR